jgi:hypothetical protein
MSTFVKGGSTSTPFGRNEFLRSTQDVKTESYTLAASTVPAKTIDGVAGMKILQPGTVLAKITSGPDAGKVGPYMAAGTKEVQTLTKAGTVSGGTFTLSFGGQTTTALAWNANAAAVQAALVALSTIGTGGVTVAGGDFSGATPFTVTFNFGTNVAMLTADTTSLTGAGAGITITESTPGGAGGSNDGRSTAANIVGLCMTFLPWQLMERDVEVSAVYQATAVQAWCFEYDNTGAAIALSNTTADAMRSTKGLHVNFK